MTKLMNTISSGPRTPARIWPLLFLALGLVLCGASPQPSAARDFDRDEAYRAIERLAERLASDFIYPDVGRRYAEMLRGKIKSGAYAKFGNACDLAAAVTADLQSTYPEGHLRLEPPAENAAGSRSAPPVARPRGVGDAVWLADGVAYLSLHGFTGDREEYGRLVGELRAALEKLATAKTLVLDVRAHPGGGMEDMDLMFSYFFSRPTTLVWMDTRLDVERRNGGSDDTATLRRIDAPEGLVRREHRAVPAAKKTALADAQLFVLTSRRTASAAEHLSLALKRTGRATLIGETTRGAGHFGRTVALGGGYRAFVPVGRTFDPDNGRGWEQTGVEPHVAVRAETALDEALRRAGLTAEAARKAAASLQKD